MSEEAKVILDGKELEVKDFSDQQKYLYNQIVDLKNKQGRLNFETDQINASLSVFENAFKERVETVRARNTKGKYVADNPSTPDVNEAYKKVPKKKGRPRKNK